MKRERVLLVVHEKTAEGWASPVPIYASITPHDQENARGLLKRLAVAKTRYDRVIQFEFDPWETVKPGEEHYTWQQVADEVGRNSIVHLAGLRRSVCVARVSQELHLVGIHVSIQPRLTID